MEKLDSQSGQVFLRSGLLLTLPPLIISFGLWGLLPEVYSSEVFGKDIPVWLGFLENLLRICVFSIPAVLYFGTKEKYQILGWYFYGGGLFLYLTSYLLVIFLPDSHWSLSLLGFTAPAWSTIFLFVGIGLVCFHTWLPILWYRGIYICISLLFVISHLGHTILIYKRMM